MLGKKRLQKVTRLWKLRKNGFLGERPEASCASSPGAGGGGRVVVENREENYSLRHRVGAH